MKRATFLKRMATAALASAFIDVDRLLPKIKEEQVSVDLTDYRAEFESSTWTAAQGATSTFAVIYDDSSTGGELIGYWETPADDFR